MTALPFRNWLWDQYEDLFEYRQTRDTSVLASLGLIGLGLAIPMVHFQTTWQLVRWGVRHDIAWAAHYAASAADDAFSMALHGKTMRAMVPRLAKVGARVVPGLGWALLAYDAVELYRTGRFWGVPVGDWAKQVYQSTQD